MLISDYFNQFSQHLASYQGTGLVVSTEIRFDGRTDTQGFISATVEFTDGSKLFVREYVDVRSGVEKFSYAYHYQDQATTLIFRYDNARHRPDLGFLDHRHTESSIVAVPIPTLESVLGEVFDYMRKSEE